MFRLVLTELVLQLVLQLLMVMDLVSYHPSALWIIMEFLKLEQITFLELIMVFVLVGPSTTGGATAEVNIDSTGKLSTISIMDGGSAYGVGHTCLLDGIPRSSSGDPGVVEVVSGDVLNEVGTSFEISGVRNITVAGIDTGKSSLNGSHQVFKIIDKNTFTYQTKTSVGTTITEVYSGYVARLVQQFQ